MTERNPLPACLSHLSVLPAEREEIRRQALEEAATEVHELWHFGIDPAEFSRRIRALALVPSL